MPETGTPCTHDALSIQTWVVLSTGCDSPQSFTSTEPTLLLIALVPQATQVMEEPAVGAGGPYQFHRHTAAAGRRGQGHHTSNAGGISASTGGSLNNAHSQQRRLTAIDDVGGVHHAGGGVVAAAHARGRGSGRCVPVAARLALAPGAAVGVGVVATGGARDTDLACSRCASRCTLSVKHAAATHVSLERRLDSMQWSQLQCVKSSHRFKAAVSSTLFTRLSNRRSSPPGSPARSAAACRWRS
jgi:hypothetical protein